MTQLENVLHILQAPVDWQDTTHASLASQVNVAEGSIMWYRKRLIRAVYTKTTRAERRLRCIVTGKGSALRIHATSAYMGTSLRAYREVRQAAHETLRVVSEAGDLATRAADDGDAMGILRPAYLEEGLRIADNSAEWRPRFGLEGTIFGSERPSRPAFGARDALAGD